MSGESKAQRLAFLLLDPAAPGLIPGESQFFSTGIQILPRLISITAGWKKSEQQSNIYLFITSIELIQYRMVTI